VGNKSDKDFCESGRVVSTNQGRKLAAKWDCPFKEVSAQDGFASWDCPFQEALREFYKKGSGTHGPRLVVAEEAVKQLRQNETSVLSVVGNTSRRRSLSWMGLPSLLSAPSHLVDLAESLCSNTSVTSLNLHGQKMGATDLTSLGEALKVNCILRILRMGDNQITNASAKGFFPALKQNKTLLALDLRGNLLDDFASIHDSFDNLQSFYLEGNPFKEPSCVWHLEPWNTLAPAHRAGCEAARSLRAMRRDVQAFRIILGHFKHRWICSTGILGLHKPEIQRVAEFLWHPSGIDRHVEATKEMFRCCRGFETESDNPENLCFRPSQDERDLVNWIHDERKDVMDMLFLDSLNILDL
jgi:hypothetical protein